MYAIMALSGVGILKNYYSNLQLGLAFADVLATTVHDFITLNTVLSTTIFRGFDDIVPGYSKYIATFWIRTDA